MFANNCVSISMIALVLIKTFMCSASNAESTKVAEHWNVIKATQAGNMHYFYVTKSGKIIEIDFKELEGLYERMQKNYAMFKENIESNSVELKSMQTNCRDFIILVSMFLKTLDLLLLHDKNKEEIYKLMRENFQNFNEGYIELVKCYNNQQKMSEKMDNYEFLKYKKNEVDKYYENMGATHRQMKADDKLMEFELDNKIKSLKKLETSYDNITMIFEKIFDDDFQKKVKLYFSDSNDTEGTGCFESEIELHFIKYFNYICNLKIGKNGNNNDYEELLAFCTKNKEVEGYENYFMLVESHLNMLNGSKPVDDIVMDINDLLSKISIQ